jgi:hypothetical protein
MANGLGWLPALVTLGSCGGDPHHYFDVLFSHFTQDFITTRPTYPGRRWAMKRHPEYEGKPATFWHLISEGADEEERLPDMRRCERIRWPRPMIDAVLTGRVLCWRKQHKTSERVLMAIDDFSYLIVLEDRGTFIMLWTAFHVEYEHRRRKLQKEWANYVKDNGPWNG